MSTYIHKIKFGLLNPKKSFYIIVVFLNKIVPWLIPDILCINAQYFLTFNKDLDLKNPRTFNEKLQWLKLYLRREIYTEMVDKVRVKQIVENIDGLNVIKTLGVYKNFEEIDFNKLPSRFVLKTNHDCASVIICKNKNEFDKNKAKTILTNSLYTNFYLLYREWPYKNVPRRIFAEEFMEDNENNDLVDYKFFCFNGKVKFFKVDFDRFTDHHANYYDIEYNILPFGEALCPPKPEHICKKPENFIRMLEIAECISKGLPFLRVDLYNINGRIYFGETTFYPATGLGKFTPEVWDKKIGDMLVLPHIK